MMPQELRQDMLFMYVRGAAGGGGGEDTYSGHDYDRIWIVGLIVFSPGSLPSKCEG